MVYNLSMKAPNDFFASYKKSVKVLDLEGMLALYSDDVVIFDMWNNYSQVGKQELSEMVTTWFNSVQERVEVDFSNISVNSNAGLAFGTAFISFRAIDKAGGVLRQMKNRMTLCFQKTDEAWQVVHQHTSIPISNDLQAKFED